MLKRRASISPHGRGQRPQPFQGRPKFVFRRLLREHRRDELFDEVDDEEAAAEEELGHWKAAEHVPGM